MGLDLCRHFNPALKGWAIIVALHNACPDLSALSQRRQRRRSPFATAPTGRGAGGQKADDANSSDCHGLHSLWDLCKTPPETGARAARPRVSGNFEITQPAGGPPALLLQWSHFVQIRVIRVSSCPGGCRQKAPDFGKNPGFPRKTLILPSGNCLFFQKYLSCFQKYLSCF